MRAMLATPSTAVADDPGPLQRARSITIQGTFMHDVDIVDVSGAGIQLVDLDDGALLAMARSGHREAYATLFSRYSYAAHRLARHLGQKEDSDDVVSEAFAQVDRKSVV